MRPSSRLDRIPPYLFAQLERKIAEKKAQGIDVISLGIGDPDTPTPQLVIDNYMYANSIHLIDFFAVFGRGPVTAVEPIIPFNRDTPRFVAAKIEFDSGDIGLYEAVWNGPGPWASTRPVQ